MIKNYIWDFDGTLFDTYGPMEKALKETFERMNFPIPKNLFFQMLDTSIRQVITDNIPLKDRDIFQKTYQENERKYQSNPQLFSGAREVLENIVKSGGQNFLYTHRDLSAIDYLKKHQLEIYFNDIITSRNHFKRKPDPEGLLFLLNHHHLKKEETAMVGDRLLDISFGKNAGVKTIWFSSYHQPLDVEADFKVKNLKEILLLEDE